MIFNIIYIRMSNITYNTNRDGTRKLIIEGSNCCKKNWGTKVEKQYLKCVFLNKFKSLKKKMF
jgi:hypothetical protein